MRFNHKSIFKKTIDEYKGCRKLRKEVQSTDLNISFTYIDIHHLNSNLLNTLPKLNFKIKYQL